MDSAAKGIEIRTVNVLFHDKTANRVFITDSRKDYFIAMEVALAAGVVAWASGGASIDGR